LEDLPGERELLEHAAKKRRLLWALLANFILLIVMLGGPWLRGVLRAHAVWSDFGRFAICVYGGKELDEPGLGMPLGSEAHFAAQLLRRPAQWPERCQALAHELLRDEPIFLLPSVKTAEADVRTAAKVVERELEGVLVRVPGERMSTRPLRAIELLRGVLSRHALTAGVLEVPMSDAFALAPGGGLPIPTRVPIYASTDARVALWGGDSELHALAVDGTGVSYVHVAGGSMSQMRQPRPKLLEAFVPSAEGGWFVWAMPQKRCREREEGCSKKALGVAPLSLPLSGLPLPRWIGAHPVGRIDRSLWFGEPQLLVIAELAEQRMQLRKFLLPPEPADQAATELPPLAAQELAESVGRGDALIATLSGEPFPMFVTHGDEASELWDGSPDGAHSLARLPASKSAWLSASSCGHAIALTFGTEHELQVGRVAADKSVQVWPPLPFGLTDVIHERDAAHDRVRNLCLPDGRALVLLRDAKDTLRALVCEPGAACSMSALATAVTSFAYALHDDQLLVAYAGSQNVAQIRLLSLDTHAEVTLAERVPAVCWAPRGGLCGTPVLARVGERVLLGAREGTDLMLLESPDEGVSWEPLRGLKRLH
jgi:hypothetical protein